MAFESHTVVRGPSLMAGGYLPVRTPSHQVVLPTGNTASTVGKRTKPSSGRVIGLFTIRFVLHRCYTYDGILD